MGKLNEPMVPISELRKVRKEMASYRKELSQLRSVLEDAKLLPIKDGDGNVIGLYESATEAKKEDDPRPNDFMKRKINGG